jgi:hypothetical protein
MKSRQELHDAEISARGQLEAQRYLRRKAQEIHWVAEFAATAVFTCLSILVIVSLLAM